MLEKRDITYYRRLAITKVAIGLSLIAIAFIIGVAARYHNSEIHVYAPYWVGIPILINGFILGLAAKTGKRWPLGIWIVFFIIGLGTVGAYMSVMPAYKARLHDRYPCYLQKNVHRGKTRCICASGSYDDDLFLKVNNAKSNEPCYRVINMIMMLANVAYMIAILSLIPTFLAFILVCNDLCCLSCRRAALVPQVLVTQPAIPGAPQQVIPVQSETVTFRTDQQAGSSTVRPVDDKQAGPLPQKTGIPSDIPHSF